MTLINIICDFSVFADDAVVFAPSAKGLQLLLDICSKFAVSHQAVFNVVKSQCLIVKSKMLYLIVHRFNCVGQRCPILIATSTLVIL